MLPSVAVATASLLGPGVGTVTALWTSVLCSAWQGGSISTSLSSCYLSTVTISWADTVVISAQPDHSWFLFLILLPLHFSLTMVMRLERAPGVGGMLATLFHMCYVSFQLSRIDDAVPTWPGGIERCRGLVTCSKTHQRQGMRPDPSSDQPPEGFVLWFDHLLLSELYVHQIRTSNNTHRKGGFLKVELLQVSWCLLSNLPWIFIDLKLSYVLFIREDDHGLLSHNNN